MHQEKRKYIGQACYICLSSKTELVSADGSIRMPLSVTEFKILSFFIDHANMPVYLEDLAQYIWGVNYDADRKDPESLKSHISRLRNKLEKIRIGLRKCLDTNYGLRSYTLKIDDSLFETNLPLEQSETELSSVDNSNFSEHIDSNPLPRIITKNSPFFADERDVICRKKEIDDLLNMLSIGKESLLLSGFGGIGKTSIARVLYSKMANKYDCIGWVEYIDDIKTSILASFDICSNIKNQDYRWIVISRLLKNTDQSILLFIDNVDTNLEKEQNPLSDRCLFEISGFPNLSIVVTSRLAEIRGYHTYQIGDLGNAECEDLFYFYYDRFDYNQPRESRKNIRIVRELVMRAGYHTFAIELLAKSAKRFPSLAQFAQSIIQVGFQFPSCRITTNYSELELDAASQLRLVFNLCNRSQLEQRILWDISVFPNTIISFSELSEWLGYNNEDYERLITDGWLSAKDGGIYMHPLVKEVIHFNLEDGKANPGTANNLVKLMNSASFFLSDDSFKAILRKFEIANSVLPFIRLEEIRIDTVRHMGVVAQQIGRVSTAIIYFKKVLDLYLSQLHDCNTPPVDEQLATAYNDLGYQLSYVNSGRSEAEILLRKALEIRESLYKSDPNHFAEQYATTCDYLGYLLSDDDHAIFEGEKLLRTALAIRINLSEKHSNRYIHDIAWTEDNLGFLLSLINEKRDEAEYHLRQALLIRRQIESENNGEYLTEVAWTCTNLAVLLQTKGDAYSEAEELYKEANAALQQADSKMPGVHAADIAINKNNMAVLIAMDQSRFLECQDLLLSALALLRALNHESLGLYSGEIAAVYENLNNLTAYYNSNTISERNKLSMNILSGARIVHIICPIFIN